MAQYLNYEGLEYYDGKLKEKLVPKETGKGLSTNDFTDADKAKLDSIAEGANKITIDSALSATSTNPVQNKIVTAELNAKAPLASPSFTGIPTAPTPANTVNNTQLATTAFVQALVNAKIAAANALTFQGTLGNSGSVTALPTTHSVGELYIVTTAGTYAGQKCEVGDMVVCITAGTAANDSHWSVVQTNIDGAVTGPTAAVEAHVAVFDGTSGKVIKDSGFTIATNVPANAKFTDTTYNNMKGATASAAGSAGLVPAPAAGDQGTKYLRADGTWATPSDTTYSNATTSTAGLMSASDKSKLDGVSSGATADSAITTAQIDALFA